MRARVQDGGQPSYALRSPDYPYTICPNGITYNWTITAPTGYYVQFMNGHSYTLSSMMFYDSDGRQMLQTAYASCGVLLRV